MSKYASARHSFELAYAPPRAAAPQVAGGAPTNPRDLLDQFLRESQRHDYEFTTALGDVLEQFVETLRFAGESSDAVIAEVDHAVRLVQPTFRFPTDEAWKNSWDAYFSLYDRLIQCAVITYFVNANEGGGSDGMKA